LRFLHHTQLYTDTLGRAPPDGWQLCRSTSYIHNTQQTQETKNNAPVGVRTHDTRNETAADLQLRRHSQQVRRSHRAFCHCLCADTQTFSNVDISK